MKGTQQLKNALRNSVVHKSATYELATSNLKDISAKTFLNVTKTVKHGRNEQGITHSALEAKFHFNTVKLQAAKDCGDVWQETDSDGDEMWYEKSKSRSVTDSVERKKEFTKDHAIKNVAEYKQMIQDSCVTNKAWLKKAIGFGNPSIKGKSSGSASGNKGVTYDTMQTMQDAWDASTQLTADAGWRRRSTRRTRRRRRRRIRMATLLLLLQGCSHSASSATTPRAR